jgi:CheY-like chemotaxis protein
LIWEPPSTEVTVDGDLVRLGQVFTNLLDNASKYSPPHGLIWLSLHVDEMSVEIRVRDRGEGIPANMLNEVFEMFAQVDRSLERTQGGLGIGLTLVKRLVEMHGGTVIAHSEGPHHGSEFSVRLPLVTVASRVLLDGTSRERVAEDAAHTILIADDNVDGAATLAMLLTARGHRVAVANDGLSAVALAETLQPTLVLLDIGMPGLNGYEVCQRLRTMPWGEHATIVALTGWGQEHDRRRSSESGFDYHIVKPVDTVMLERLLQAAPLSASKTR